MKKLLLISISAVAVFCAAPAHADDQDYLDTVSMYGMNVTDQTAPVLITVGKAICADLRDGGDPTTESAAIFRIAPTISEKQSGNLVSAAQMKLCPETI